MAEERLNPQTVVYITGTIYLANEKALEYSCITMAVYLMGNG